MRDDITSHCIVGFSATASESPYTFIDKYCISSIHNIDESENYAKAL